MAGGKSFKASGLSKKELETKMKQIGYSQAAKALNNRAERYYYLNTSYATGTSSSTTPGIVSMTDVSQETSSAGDSVRSGDEIYITSFQFRYYLTVGDSYNVIRMMFFQWQQDDTPTAADILADTSSNPVLSPYRKDTSGHYKILYDKVHVLDTYNTVQKASGFISKSLKKKIKYDGGTTTGQNKIYFLNVSDSAAVAHPSYFLTTQLNFKDF